MIERSQVQSLVGGSGRSFFSRVSFLETLFFVSNVTLIVIIIITDPDVLIGRSAVVMGRVEFSIDLFLFPFLAEVKKFDTYSSISSLYVDECL